MRRDRFLATVLFLGFFAPIATAQTPRDDPDSPDYLRDDRPRAQSPQAQGRQQGEPAQGQGRASGRQRAPEPPKPAPKPEPRAILAIDDAINDLAFHHNGLFLVVAAGADTLITTGPGNAQVWDLMASPPHKSATIPGHLSFVTQSIAASPTDDIVAVGDQEGGLVLWDGLKHANRAGVDVDWREGVAPRHDRDRTGAVDSLTFSPDGKSVAFLPSIAGRVRVHDASDGRELRYWKTRAGYEVIALAFDKGHPLALVEQGIDPFDPFDTNRSHDLVVWDVDEGQPRATIGLKAPIGQLAFAPDGRRLAYLAPYVAEEGRPEHNEVTLRDVGTSKVKLTYCFPSEPGALAFDAGGSRLAVSGEDRVVLLDARTAKPIKELRAPGRQLGRVVFGDEDALLAVAADREVILWDVAGYLPGPEPIEDPSGPPRDPNGPIPPPR